MMFPDIAKMADEIERSIGTLEFYVQTYGPQTATERRAADIARCIMLRIYGEKLERKMEN